MAQSICPKSESSSFEMKEHTHKNARYPVNFIQCSSCGCVVGVCDYTNASYYVQLLAEKLKIDLFKENF